MIFFNDNNLQFIDGKIFPLLKKLHYRGRKWPGKSFKKCFRTVYEHHAANNTASRNIVFTWAGLKINEGNDKKIGPILEAFFKGEEDPILRQKPVLTQYIADWRKPNNHFGLEYAVYSLIIS